MRRVAVLGAPGAGKSTFAKELGTVLDLPVHHLDEHYWREGWTRPDDATWHAQHRSLIEEDSWVIDGTYTETLNDRLDRADVAILLVVPTYVSLKRLLQRQVSLAGQSRPTMSGGCPERIDTSLLWYAARFNDRWVPRLQRRMAAADVHDVLLTAATDRNKFLENLRVDQKVCWPVSRDASKTAR